MLGYDSEFDDLELEELEPVKGAVDDEFDRHADYPWDDDPYPFEGEYAEYEGTEGVKSEEGDDNICKKCDGTGEFPDDHLCKACEGKGRIEDVA